MRTWKCFFVAVLVGVLAACGGGDASDLTTGEGLLGQAAPDFALVSNTGETVRLSDQRGKVVMLNFWASWCGPCRKEMPLLDELYRRYSAAGFMLYGVNVEEDSTDAKKLVKELGVTFSILFDTQSQAGTLYNIDAMPTTIVIDKKGEIRFVNRGYKAGDEVKYREEIRELIKE